MKQWKWQIYSVLVSVVTMAFVYAILSLPIKGAITAFFGLAVLLGFLLYNPIRRYMRLAIILLSVWGGMFSGIELSLDVTYRNIANLYFSYGVVDWYLHVIFLVLIVVLLILDYIVDKQGEQNKKTLTKNRLILILAQLRYFFFSFIAILAFILVLLLFGDDSGPEEPVKVSIDRTADFTGTGCQDGRRMYRNIITDNLTFSENVDIYVAQARTSSNNGKQSVKISYRVRGKSVKPHVFSEPDVENHARKKVEIPVQGKRLTVIYDWDQEVPSNDNEWGLSFISTRPISKVSAEIILPVGKQVLGLHPEYKASVEKQFAGCDHEFGFNPTLNCPSFKGEINVKANYVWRWNVFDGC